MVKATSKSTKVEESVSEDDVVDEQFPSLSGDPVTEVAERTADGSEGLKFGKDFVVLAETPGIKPSADEDSRACGAVLQEAISRGLHPSGEPTFEGASVHEDGNSTVWHYSVAVTPAVIDHEPADTVTPSNSNS